MHRGNVYWKKISGAKNGKIDVYSICAMYELTPALSHAIKKILVPGQRGSKSVVQDLKEAILTIDREIEIREIEIGKPEIGEQEIGEPGPIMNYNYKFRLQVKKLNLSNDQRLMIIDSDDYDDGILTTSVYQLYGRVGYIKSLYMGGHLNLLDSEETTFLNTYLNYHEEQQKIISEDTLPF